ncbi:MAG: hypothetical protein EPO21_01510 [Chloroflexota bacterium]|nr:MAG: hypothetical protein EPO21_01510 [Chloroflexota bacterium]
MRYDNDPASRMGEFFAIALLVMVLVAIRLILMETVRVYRAHAVGGGKYSRLLWYALAGFLVCVGISVLLAASPATIALAPWPVSLGFLVWVLIFEAVDILGEPVQQEENIEDLLAPWRFGDPSGSTNDVQPADMAA